MIVVSSFFPSGHKINVVWIDEQMNRWREEQMPQPLWRTLFFPRHWSLIPALARSPIPFVYKGNKRCRWMAQQRSQEPGGHPVLGAVRSECRKCKRWTTQDMEWCNKCMINVFHFHILKSIDCPFLYFICKLSTRLDDECDHNTDTFTNLSQSNIKPSGVK